MFYVQHLLGIGHLVRAARIVKALSVDFEVALVVGGDIPLDLDIGSAALIRLAPVKAGQGFSALVHPDGTAFDAAAQATRRDHLLQEFDRVVPDVLVIEAFPFGRRQMRFELLPLLDRARNRPAPPLIVSSVRDILQEHRKPERITETLDLIAKSFDVILVHGDPALVKLEDSFPPACAFAGKIAYTGLVAPLRPLTAPPAAARFGAAVSVGGGAVGGALLRTALAARSLTPLHDRPWLLLTGPNLPAADREALQRASGDGILTASFVPDLAATLREAELSISQAGYNTVADVLIAGCRSVLIPFAGDGETEQGVRAALLEKRGRAVAVAEQALEPASLAAAIARALSLPVPPIDLALDGAAETSRILKRLLRGGG